MEGSKVDGVAERLDTEEAQEGQWSVSVEPQGSTQGPLRPLNDPLTGEATGPSQGSNTEGEQSPIVLLLPVAVTLKVGRVDPQGVLSPHPVPTGPCCLRCEGEFTGRAAGGQGIPNSWRGRGEGPPPPSLSLSCGHTQRRITRVPLETLGVPLPLQPPPPACHWWWLQALATPLRSPRQKGTVPLLLREWRLCWKITCPRLSLLPFSPPAGAESFRDRAPCTRTRAKTKTPQTIQGFSGLSHPQVQGLRGWREQGDGQASEPQRGGGKRMTEKNREGERKPAVQGRGVSKKRKLKTRGRNE